MKVTVRKRNHDKYPFLLTVEDRTLECLNSLEENGYVHFEIPVNKYKTKVITYRVDSSDVESDSTVHYYVEGF